MTLKTYYFCSLLAKPRSITTETKFSVQLEDSCLNSILMLGDCVCKKLSLKVIFSYRSSRSVNMPSLKYKAPLWCVHVDKNGSLGEWRDWRLTSCLLVCMVCWSFLENWNETSSQNLISSETSSQNVIY